MPWTSLVLSCRRIVTAIFLMPVLLFGCATVPAPSPADVAKETAPRPYHENIVIGGRLAVQYQQHGRDEAVHGSFNWVQRTGRTTVTLLSPLGQTIAIIEITPGMSTLTQAGQAPRTAEHVDALVADTLGWPLPVSGLRDWLQGFVLESDGQRSPVPAVADSGTTTSRDGWRLQYPNWQNDGSEVRPRRIDMHRSTANAGEVAIRIIIDTWQPA